MKEKIKAMLSSVRFWYMVGIAIIGIFETYNVIPEGTGEKVADMAQLFLGASIAVRTIDKFVPKPE